MEIFLNTIKDIDKRVSNIERTSQPQLIDWYELNPSLFTYSSDNVLIIDDSLVTAQFFQVGDKIRINQSGYKYFYIIEADYTAKTITLNAGDDYTFTNASFTSFGFSRIASPTGHPLVFDYSNDVKIYTYGISGYYDDTSAFELHDLKYSMNGPVVQLWVAISTSTLRADTFRIAISTPFLSREGMAELIYGTNVLLAGSYGSGMDVHTLYDWSNWVVGVDPGPFPSEAGMEIYTLGLGGSFDPGAFWWVCNMTVTV